MGEVGNVFAGEEGGRPVLPGWGFAFDFAFGLRRGGVEETDAIEAEGLAQLREGVWGGGEEEGVEVDGELEGQAVLAEGRGEEVVLGEEGFVLVEFGGGEEAAAIVEQVEPGEKLFAGREPAVRRSVELPEFADRGSLPAANGGRGFGVGFGGSEVMFDGPMADLSAIEFEATEAQDFAGGEAVVGRGMGGEPLAQQGGDFGGPGGGGIAARGAGRPVVLLLVGAGAEGLGVELVEAAAGEVELAGGAAGVALLGAEGGQDVTDQRRSQTVSELLMFFIGRVEAKRARES